MKKSMVSLAMVASLALAGFGCSGSSDDGWSGNNNYNSNSGTGIMAKGYISGATVTASDVKVAKDALTNANGAFKFNAKALNAALNTPGAAKVVFTSVGGHMGAIAFGGSMSTTVDKYAASILVNPATTAVTAVLANNPALSMDVAKVAVAEMFSALSGGIGSADVNLWFTAPTTTAAKISYETAMLTALTAAVNPQSFTTAEALLKMLVNDSFATTMAEISTLSTRHVNGDTGALSAAAKAGSDVVNNAALMALVENAVVTALKDSMGVTTTVEAIQKEVAKKDTNFVATYLVNGSKVVSVWAVKGGRQEVMTFTVGAANATVAANATDPNGLWVKQLTAGTINNASQYYNHANSGLTFSADSKALVSTDGKSVTATILGTLADKNNGTNSSFSGTATFASPVAGGAKTTLNYIQKIFVNNSSR